MKRGSEPWSFLERVWVEGIADTMVLRREQEAVQWTKASKEREEQKAD